MASSIRLNTLPITQPITLRLNYIFYRAMPRHPLFWRDFGAARYPGRAQQQGSRRWGPAQNSLFLRQIIRLGAPVIALMIICPAIVVLAIPGLAFFPLLVFAGGTLIGVNAAFGVCNVVSAEFDNGRGDVLALTPAGLVGANWALAARFLRTNRRWRQLYRLITGIFIMVALWVIFGVGLTSLLLLDSSSLGVVLEDAMALPINTVMFVGLLYLDARQSTIIGALIGMAMPTFIRSRLDTTISAVAMFLGMQFVTYILIFFVAFWLPGVLLALFQIEGWLLHSIVHCGIALTIREFSLWLVWGWTAQRLNTDLTELESLARPTYF